MSKLCRASLALLLWAPVMSVPVVASAQQPANPVGAEANPQQGEVQQTPGQQTPEQARRPVAEPPMIGMNSQTTGRIQLDVVVTDKKGKPVTGLGQQDFKLLDNGQARPILSFHAYAAAAHSPEPPVQVAIVVDSVNGDYLDNERARVGIERFLHENGGHLAYPTSVFVFGDDGIRGQLQPSTDGNVVAKNLDEMRSNLRSLTQTAGTWGEIDRFELSMKAIQVLGQNLAQLPGRKLLLWVGEGWPLMDTFAIQTSDKGMESEFQQIIHFSNLFREGQITMYSISLGNPDTRNTLYFLYLKGARNPKQSYPGDLNNRVFAVQTGGLVMGPDQDLTPQINTCVQDASAYYRISFDPPKADGKDDYHDLKVVIDKPGLKARTTTGYYDEP
jgi:VWFA-related protein